MTDRQLPRDEVAEFSMIGCMLQSAMDDRFEYQHIPHVGLRTLAETIDELRHEGIWYVARSNHPGHELEAGRANAEVLCHLMEQRGSWPCASDLRHVVFVECIERATTPALVSHYVDRLIDCHERRERIEQLETELKAAYRGEVA